MKGLSQTLWIVIAIVIVLVVALVILTIFGSSTGQFATITEARNNCVLQGQSTCASASALPINWETNFRIAATGETTNCATLTGRSDCGDWRATQAP